ncbi:MAG TPA: hypothetical protein VF211_10355 [Burkholderiales bacterium]
MDPLQIPPERDEKLVRWIPLVVPLLALVLIVLAGLIQLTVM